MTLLKSSIGMFLESLNSEWYLSHNDSIFFIVGLDIESKHIIVVQKS